MASKLRGKHSTSILVAGELVKIAQKVEGFKGCSLGEIKKSSNRSKPGFKVKKINPAVLEIKVHGYGSIQKVIIFLESGINSEDYSKILKEEFDKKF